MNRAKIKELLVIMRNGLAFSFSWLVICVMVLTAAYGKESVSLSLLSKLLLLCAWAVLCFALCFGDVLFRKKGFIFRLTLFYVLFIPVELAMFFFMNLFTRKGTMLEWVTFAGIIVGLYLVCVLIDWIVCRKQGALYTKQLLSYNERRKHEQ